MTQPPSVVARVVEPKWEPRPTLYPVFCRDGQHWRYSSMSLVGTTLELAEDEILVIVSGELEQQRTTAIESARDAVIEAAKGFMSGNMTSGDIHAALSTLAAAEGGKQG